jgi:EAL domain-containing protein (putative c-di-GMP-specific phosphodiesterase class I)/integral membrane sensor domain MASE1
MTPQNAAPRPAFLLAEPIRAGLGVHLAALVATMLAAELSRAFTVSGPEAALIWPPAGMALGLALTFGARILPTTALALLLWALAFKASPLSLWLIPAAALVVGPGVAVAGMRWVRRRGWARGPVAEQAAFWVFGPVVSVAISSLLGTLNVRTEPGFADYSLGEIWAAYWAAEAFGVLIFGPLAARLGGALAQGRLRAALAPRPWQLAWVAALVALAGAQVGLGLGTHPEFAGPMLYLYFPLLAVAALLAAPLAQDLATAVVTTGAVWLVLVGAGGPGAPEGNFAIIDAVLLVLAFAVMTQLVSTIATALRRHLEVAREAARRDYLTGLYNERELAAVLDGAPGGSLALIDVDGIRQGLDLVGLERVNEIERRLTDRLAGALPADSVLARLGRGLYALFRPGDDEAGLRQAVAPALAGVDGLRFEGTPVPLTLHPVCGAVLLDGSPQPADEALAMAGQTLREAQSSPGAAITVRRSDSDLLANARADQEMAEDLRERVARRDGLALVAQPIVALQDSSARPYFELLVRLPGPDGELRAPGVFLPVAARHDLMPAIDRWVVERAMEVVAGHEVTLSVNLSGASLTDPGLMAWIEERRRAHGAPAERICFEVTETEPIETFDTAAGIVEDLQRSGFGTALDDFGTGLASFDYVRRFAFGALKIDGSFVRAAAESESERAMVEAIQSVANTTGMRTIAEFVEDDWTRDWLASIGVDYGQGFGLGRPRPLAEALADVAAADRAREGR